MCFGVSDRVPVFPPHLTVCRVVSDRVSSRECPPARRSDLERRLPPPPTALPLFHSPCSAGVDPGLVDAPPHILCVAPVCARMVCGVGCVRGRTSPECAAAAQCPRVRAPSVMCQRLRQPRISSSLGSRLSRLSLLLAGDGHGSLHALSSVPHSPRPTPSPPGGCVSGSVCDMRMWRDDVWDRMLPHGSWRRVGGGRLWRPACEFHDGARCPTPHRR